VPVAASATLLAAATNGAGLLRAPGERRERGRGRGGRAGTAADIPSDGSPRADGAPPATKMEHLDVGSGQLSYVRAGTEGDPVILVHGGWDDHRLWDPLAASLGSSLQLLSYDRRGHGESSARVGERPVLDDTLDLAAVLEGTDHFPAHLVAQGYGGSLALRLALDRPELVRSVAVHEPPFWQTAPPGRGAAAAPPLSVEVARLVRLAGESGAEAVARSYLEALGSPEERWDRWDADARARLLENAGAWAREMADPESGGPGATDLSGLAVPALVTFGGRSPRLAAMTAEALGGVLANSTVVQLPEVGHWAPRTEPSLYAGVLGSFLLERNVPST